MIDQISLPDIPAPHLASFNAARYAPGTPPATELALVWLSCVIMETHLLLRLIGWYSHRAFCGDFGIDWD
jgi:hypothetical protein